MPLRKLATFAAIDHNQASSGAYWFPPRHSIHKVIIIEIHKYARGNKSCWLKIKKDKEAKAQHIRSKHTKYLQSWPTTYVWLMRSKKEWRNHTQVSEAIRLSHCWRLRQEALSSTSSHVLVSLDCLVLLNGWLNLDSEFHVCAFMTWNTVTHFLNQTLKCMAICYAFITANSKLSSFLTARKRRKRKQKRDSWHCWFAWRRRWDISC